MFTKTFDEITKADIDRLVTDGIREGRQLDYKAELPGRTDKDKKELARDVTSFANAAGGYVIYGITDQKDAAGKNTGVPAPVTGLSGVNGEQEILRLEGMIRGNVDPGIPGVRMKAVDGFADGPVIILQIPKSWSAPHMVNVDKDSRFYSRGSGGKQPLDVREIRSAFTLSAEMPMLIRRFRDERLGRIIADETPVALTSPDRLVLHLVPFSSMGSEVASIDLEKWAQKPVPPLDPRGWDHRYNFDGFLTHSGPSAVAQRSYFQVFRSGAIEAATALIGRKSDGMHLSPWELEIMILNELPTYVERYQQTGVEPPFVIMVSILSVKGAKLPFSQGRTKNYQMHAIERETLLLPDVLVKEYGEDLPKQLRPAFDALWQSLGIPRSLCYDKDGNWKGHQFQW